MNIFCSPFLGSRRSDFCFMTLVVLGFLTAWLWPFHEKPWTSFQQEFVAFGSGLLLLAMILFRPVRMPVSVVGFFLLALVPWLQFWCGLVSFSGDAWVASGYILGFSSMLLVGYSLGVNAPSRLFFARFMAAGIVLAATLSGWIALRQYFHLADSIFEIQLKGGRPYANLGQPNHLATLLSLGVAGCFYLYERHLLNRLSAGLLTAFLVLGIAVTQSRTPWVATLAVVIFLTLKNWRLSLRLPTWAILAWAGFYMGCVLLLPHIGEWLQLSTISLSQRASALERWDLWLQFWEAVWHGPLWGYGWGQVIHAQFSVLESQPLGMMAEYSHNVILDILLWNGPLLGGVIVSLIGVWLWRLGWHAKSCEALFALLASGFVLTHSMLEFPFAYAYFLLPLGVFLGLAVADKPFVRSWRFSGYFLSLFLVGGCVFLWLAFKEYGVIRKDYFAQRMVAARVVGFERERSIDDVFFLTQLRELQVFRWMIPCKGMSEDELERMEVVVRRYPHLANIYRYALSLALNGYLERSEEYLNVMRSLHGEEPYRQAVEEITRNLAGSVPGMPKGGLCGV